MDDNVEKQDYLDQDRIALELFADDAPNPSETASTPPPPQPVRLSDEQSRLIAQKREAARAKRKARFQLGLVPPNPSVDFSAAQSTAKPGRQLSPEQLARIRRNRLIVRQRQAARAELHIGRFELRMRCSPCVLRKCSMASCSITAPKLGTFSATLTSGSIVQPLSLSNVAFSSCMYR